MVAFATTTPGVVSTDSIDQTTGSPYHLSAEHIQFFDRNGYLILRNWIPQPMLAQLQAAGQAWIDTALAATADDLLLEDYGWAQRPHGRTLFRINYLHNKQQAISLALLGAPQVLAVAESLCGPNFVPTYESMVFKQTGDGEAIPWHQDATHPRTHRIFNFDLYLDRSQIGGGALRAIPQTQKHKQNICALTEAYGWDAPGVVHVEMEPGDVLLHDVMVVHGSERVSGNALRRTIYYEFRAAEEIVQDGPWDREWIERRLRLVPLGLQRHRQAFPDDDQFAWRVGDEFRPESSGDEAHELKVAHVVHSPGAFCSAGDAGR